MINIGIDVGKFKHCACIMDDKTGEILKDSFFFDNNKEGFQLLYSNIKPYLKRKHKAGMEDTGHYGNNLINFLLDNNVSVALINPRATNLRRKQLGQNAKNDRKDAQLIAQMLTDTQLWRSVSKNSLAYRELRDITRLYHQLKEQMNEFQNRLQKALDIVFPEVNSLPWTPYSHRYMNMILAYPSAASIASADIRSLRKILDGKGRGRKSKLTAENLKMAAKASVGDGQNPAAELEVKAMINIITSMDSQINILEKKIEDFSSKLNSPITSIPGIGPITGMTILAEIGDIQNFSSAAGIVSYAGMDPGRRQSGTYDAKHLPISKHGSRYLRKALYQAAFTVTSYEPIFHLYYKHKMDQGKIYRCAQGHAARKLIRVIYKLLSTNTSYNPALIN
jgi:transposase